MIYKKAGFQFFQQNYEQKAEQKKEQIQHKTEQFLKGVNDGENEGRNTVAYDIGAVPAYIKLPSLHPLEQIHENITLLYEENKKLVESLPTTFAEIEKNEIKAIPIKDILNFNLRHVINKNKDNKRLLLKTAEQLTQMYAKCNQQIETLLKRYSGLEKAQQNTEALKKQLQEIKLSQLQHHTTLAKKNQQLLRYKEFLESEKQQLMKQVDTNKELLCAIEAKEKIVQENKAIVEKANKSIELLQKKEQESKVQFEALNVKEQELLVKEKNLKNAFAALEQRTQQIEKQQQALESTQKEIEEIRSKIPLIEATKKQSEELQNKNEQLAALQQDLHIKEKELTQKEHQLTLREAQLSNARSDEDRLVALEKTLLDREHEIEQLQQQIKEKIAVTISHEKDILLEKSKIITLRTTLEKRESSLQQQEQRLIKQQNLCEEKAKVIEDIFRKLELDNDFKVDDTASENTRDINSWNHDAGVSDNEKITVIDYESDDVLLSSSTNGQKKFPTFEQFLAREREKL